jgi:hypothetical protein
MLVLAVGFAGGRTLQNAFTLAPAILGTTVGLSGLLFGSYAANHYSMPELADPSDRRPADRRDAGRHNRIVESSLRQTRRVGRFPASASRPRSA